MTRLQLLSSRVLTVVLSALGLWQQVLLESLLRQLSDVVQTCDCALAVTLMACQKPHPGKSSHCRSLPLPGLDWTSRAEHCIAAEQ